VGGHLGGESSSFRKDVNIYRIYPWELSLSFAVIDDCSSRDIAHSIRCFFLFFIFIFATFPVCPKKDADLQQRTSTVIS
jgi:hypothetical protein